MGRSIANRCPWIDRDAVAELTGGEAVKRSRRASALRGSELPKRRTKDRDSIPEDGAYGVDQG